MLFVIIVLPTKSQKGKSCPMYIITYEYELEQQKEYELKIEPPAEMSCLVGAAVSVRYQAYHIEYTRHHEIVCPRYSFADGSNVVVIPWFLIPGRPYPTQVYLYACGMYSSNPTIGQRGAAEATRKKFRLEKFSHSTVSRSFRAIEESRKQCLNHKFGKEIKPCSPEWTLLVTAAKKSQHRESDTLDANRRFPSIQDTGKRRKRMAAFLWAYFRACEKCGLETASRQFVEGWHKKARRLLL